MKINISFHENNSQQAAFLYEKAYWMRLHTLSVAA